MLQWLLRNFVIQRLASVNNIPKKLLLRYLAGSKLFLQRFLDKTNKNMPNLLMGNLNFQIKILPPQGTAQIFLFIE